MSKVSLVINDREVKVDDSKTILQAAEENSIEIPHLCYDERMKPYGACGLCVVEIEGNPKLQRACATPVVNGMVVQTDTNRTIAARKTALNLLASDHRGDCRPPCAIACPAHTDCQGYVGLVANGQYDEALKLVKDKIPLPASIGRVCPHPCEEECRRHLVEKPIAIAEIKRFLGDMDIEKGGYIPPVEKSSGKTVAVVGSGPAGLSAAYFLAMKGHKVTVFEAMPNLGGMLRYGIPEYRLPKDILDAEIDMIGKMGVTFKTGIRLGSDVTLEYLKDKHDIVFLALGAWKSMGLRCPGEDMEGVMGGIEFLRKVTMNQPIYVGKDVVVIGGGNTAMDAARTAVRLGAKSVLVLYRRTREEMPAEDIEIEEAEEEGVEFKYLVAPIEITGDGERANAVRCQKMKLGEPDASGRRKPEPIPGEEIIFKADLIISAIGQTVSVEGIKGLVTSRKGTIVVEEGTFETNIDGVFAGGEVVTGPHIAISAIASGKAAAEAIDGYIKGNLKRFREPMYVTQDDLTEKDFLDRERIGRVKPVVVEAKERKLSFRPISRTLNIEEALKESKRCLECGCRDYFECQLFKYFDKYEIDPNAIKVERRNRLEKQNHPFIVRNPDKCVLCGLCIRACDEVMGITALGLEARGYDSQVKPEFGMPLEDTACIACGQCVDVCPTGACMEIPPVKKPVPVNPIQVKSICSGCSTGCNLILETKGNLVFRAVPDRETEEGLLCKRGKFGLNYMNDDDRILSPVIRGEEKEIDASFKDAIAVLVKKLQLIKAQYGEDSIGILASPTLSNEEAFLLKNISRILDTCYVGSYSFERGRTLKDVFGYDASPNSFDELYGTDLIISLGQVAENHTVLGVRMKLASDKGAKLVSISGEKTKLQDYAEKSYIVKNSTDFLRGMLKSIINNGFVDTAALNKVNEFEKLKSSLDNVLETSEAEELARMYGEAKKSIIVVDEDTVTPDALMLVSDMAALTGKIGKPYRGIILSRKKNNTQGFVDMGINVPGEKILDMVDSGQIKGLLVLGEDIVKVKPEFEEKLSKLEFLGVFDMYMTETAKLADVVIPLAGHAAEEGTFTRSDRRIQSFSAAVKPRTLKSSLEVMADIALSLGMKVDIDKIDESISLTVKEYSGLSRANLKENIYWPNSVDNPYGKQVMYSSGFATNDGKVNLAVVESVPMFKEKKVYDTIDIGFEE